MIQISPVLSPHINMGGLVHLENTRAAQRSILAEAEACPGAEEVVEHVRTEVEKTEARLARFEAALAPLETAIREHANARAACVSAVHAHGQGSEDRKTALRLRDDLEFAQQVERIARRRLDAAKAALPNLPTSGGSGFDAEMHNARGIVEAMSATSANRLFKRRDGKFEQETWDRWVSLSSDHIRWIPLFLNREISSCEAAWGKNKSADRIIERGETHLPDPEDLKAFYKQLVDDREARRQGKLLDARRRLTQAEQEAAQ